LKRKYNGHKGADGLTAHQTEKVSICLSVFFALMNDVYVFSFYLSFLASFFIADCEDWQQV